MFGNDFVIPHLSSQEFYREIKCEIQQVSMVRQIHYDLPDLLQKCLYP